MHLASTSTVISWATEVSTQVHYALLQMKRPKSRGNGARSSFAVVRLLSNLCKSIWKLAMLCYVLVHFMPAPLIHAFWLVGYNWHMIPGSSQLSPRGADHEVGPWMEPWQCFCKSWASTCNWNPLQKAKKKKTEIQLLIFCWLLYFDHTPDGDVQLHALSL